MEILELHPNDPIRNRGGVALALGFFDGVHIGHAALLRQTVKEAQAIGVPPAVLTFHTQMTVKGGARLTGEEERFSLMEACGIEKVYVMTFEEVRTLSPVAFVDEILIGMLDTRVALCGFNYRFGAMAEGNAALLKHEMEKRDRRAISLEATTAHDGTVVSSTAIRTALEEGDVARAAEMLARPYSLTAPVLHGQALGRTMGLPTINQIFPDGIAIPKNGVYVTNVYINGLVFTGLTNVGTRPTVGGKGVNCETHILSYSGTLYGQTVTVAFIDRLREEIRFDSPDALRAQIMKDISEVKNRDKYRMD